MSEQPLLNAIKAKNDPALNGTCLMLINPSEASFGATIAKKRGGVLHKLFHSTLISFTQEEPACHWVGPCVGSPMAVMTLEKLIALGLRKLIVFGWCGSLTPTMQIGDLFIPQYGFSDEGVSRHYPSATPPTTCQTLEKYLTTLFPACHQGKIWTTDAPFRELPKDIALHQGNGVQAVDMEFTALCTVCHFYTIEMAGLMVVSDELYHPTRKSGIATKQFRKKTKSTLNILMDTLPR